MWWWSQAIAPLGQITRLNGRRIGCPVHLWHAVVFSPRTLQDHRTLGITMPRCRCYWRALPILRVFTYYCICRTTSWRCKAAERFPTVLSAHYSGCIALFVIAQLFPTRVYLALVHTIICPTRHLNLIFHHIALRGVDCATPVGYVQYIFQERSYYRSSGAFELA